MNGIITLTTDFGTEDHYVACLKGVILQVAPRTRIVDVTHAIRPHDIVHAAFILRQVFETFPEGTIHVAVIDPGVGTSRRLLAARYEGQTFLGPDNGLITLVHRGFALQELRVIDNAALYRAEISATFHGRDILAPVAGHLAAGLTLDRVGPPTSQLEMLNLDRPQPLPNRGLEGQVLYVDRFGNLITNIAYDDLQTAAERVEDLNVYVGPLRVGAVQTTYGEAKTGEVVALVGSTGMLEVAVNQGNAAAQLGAQPGSLIVVR